MTNNSVPLLSARFTSFVQQWKAFSNAENIAFVPREGLCTMCGTCAGLCPVDAISMVLDPDKGIYRPVIAVSSCIRCGFCLAVCPGYEVDLQLFDPSADLSVRKYSPLFGRYSELFRMQATENIIRENGASGGMLTAVLIHLFDHTMIDGAVVTGMDRNQPLKATGYIVTTKEELFAAQRSKYLPNPLNGLLKEVVANWRGKRLAFVGLPCHVEGLRLAQDKLSVLKETVKFVLSPFCSRTPSLHATRFLMNCCGVDESMLKNVEYRSGQHPGCLTFTLQNSEQVHVHHLDWKYWGYAFMEFFYPRRCFLCFDKTSELTDLSFGDNYQVERSGAQVQYPGPTSTVIVRSSAGRAIIDAMLLKKTALCTNQLTEQEFINDQDLVIKKAVGNRYWLMKLLKQSVPLHREEFKISTGKLPQTLWQLFNVFLMEHRLQPKVLYLYILSAFSCRCVTQMSGRLFRYFKKIVTGVFKLLALFKLSKRQVRVNSLPKVVMIGGFGWLDIGDESMPHADRLNLKQICPTLDIVMFSPAPVDTEKYHGERAVHDLLELGFCHEYGLVQKVRIGLCTLLFLLAASMERLGWRVGLGEGRIRTALDELATADALFNVGGGNLNSIMPTELYKKCTTYLAASIMNKPIVISGQTIGPFNRKIDATYAKFALNRVNLITFRDKNTSRLRLSQIGVNKPKMVDSSDDAITLPGTALHDAKRLLCSAVPSDWWRLQAGCTVVMNLKGSLKLFKGHNRGGTLDNEIKLMTEIADFLVTRYDARIFFLPTDYSNGVDDRELHRQIIVGMVRAERAVSIEVEFTDKELKGLIALADMAIGARYHFCVFAASELVPFLGMASGEYQQTKLQGLANLCELPECYVPLDLEYCNFDDLLPYVEQFVGNLQIYRQVLAANVPLLKKRSLIGIEKIFDLISKRNAQY